MIRFLGLVALCIVGLVEIVPAQGAAQAPADEGWRINAYPIFVWVPLDIGIDVDIPPFDGGDGGSGGIVDSHLDGAFFGGVTVDKGPWRAEGYVIWAAFGGDADRPFLDVDLDLVYGDARFGRRVARDLYIMGGVRRLSLKYDIALGNLPRLSRKPGVWDPIVGIGWHRVRQKVEWHAAFEGGGFGVGADVDIGAGARVDWKPVRHFGFAAGYNFLYLKVSDEVGGRTVTIEPMAHGPVIGIGLYF